MADDYAAQAFGELNRNLVREVEAVRNALNQIIQPVVAEVAANGHRIQQPLRGVMEEGPEEQRRRHQPFGIPPAGAHPAYNNYNPGPAQNQQQDAAPPPPMQDLPIVPPPYRHFDPLLQPPIGYQPYMPPMQNLHMGPFPWLHLPPMPGYGYAPLPPLPAPRMQPPQPQPVAVAPAAQQPERNTPAPAAAAPPRPAPLPFPPHPHPYARVPQPANPRNAAVPVPNVLRPFPRPAALVPAQEPAREQQQLARDLPPPAVAPPPPLRAVPRTVPPPPPAPKRERAPQVPIGRNRPQINQIARPVPAPPAAAVVPIVAPIPIAPERPRSPAREVPLRANSPDRGNTPPADAADAAGDNAPRIRRGRRRHRRYMPDLAELPRNEGESNETYESRNDFYCEVILPKMALNHRLTREFVLWALPGVIPACDAEIARIARRRGERFDVMKFIEAENLIPHQPFEARLHERFPITEHEMHMELLAYQAEEFIRTDTERPERSPSPEIERIGNESGLMFFNRTFGDVARRADISPAPGDVPDDLEEALNLLARVPDGTGNRQNYDNAWFKKQVVKIRRTIKADIKAIEDKNLEARRVSAREESMQLSYTLVTMPLAERRKIWHRAIRRQAETEGIALQDPFGADMYIPPVRLDPNEHEINAEIVPDSPPPPPPKKSRIEVKQGVMIYDPTQPGPSNR